MFDADTIYFVTSRTFQGRHLMKPSEEVNFIISRLLKKAAHVYEIELFAYVFMSNHFHLIIRGLPEKIPRFVGWLKREIARAVGRKLKRWLGSFWSRRYDAAAVIDDQALRDRLTYIATHGVKENLVERATDWPGLHCIEALVHAGSSDVGSAKPKGEAAEEHARDWLSLSRLPEWTGLSEKRYQAVIREVLTQAERSALLESKAEPPRSLKDVSPQHLGPPLKTGPAPMCHASTKRMRTWFRNRYREFRAAYRRASHKYRLGRSDVEFPPGAFKPSVPPQTSEQKDRSTTSDTTKSDKSTSDLRSSP